MDSAPFPAREVACPACQGVSLYHPSNPYRPFCSARCRHRDLGAWANEEFRVSQHPEHLEHSGHADDVQHAPHDSSSEASH